MGGLLHPVLSLLDYLAYWPKYDDLIGLLFIICHKEDIIQNFKILSVDQILEKLELR